MTAPIPDEQAALLAAICAEPDDDTPRLVYADWLQEHGDEEQADFIRGSIKLSLMEPKGKIWKTQITDLREMLAEYREAWCEPFGIDATASIQRYERGFPFRATFDGPDMFFRAADTWCNYIPIQGVEITSGLSEFDTESLVRLMSLSVSTRLTDLRLHGHSYIAILTWKSLFYSKLATGLTHLAITTSDIHASVVIELASSPSLAKLTSLDLSYNPIGVEGGRAILQSPHLTNLKHLWLDECLFGEEGADEILEAWSSRLGNGFHVFESPDHPDYEDEELI